MFWMVRLEGDTEPLMGPALAPTMSHRDRNLRVSSYLFLAFCERPPWLGVSSRSYAFTSQALGARPPDISNSAVGIRMALFLRK